MRILFIGCVKSSELFLEKLVEIKTNIVGVVTMEESRFNTDFVDLGEICRIQEIDYLYVKHINSTESKTYILSKKPDLILCLGWSQLLDKEVLAIPKIGCVGFHPAALPANRGRHPLIWALALNLKRTASTFFMLEDTADTGGILSQQYVEIEYEDDAYTLYNKIMAVAVVQLEILLEEFENQTVKTILPVLAQGNTWRKRGGADGIIDWRMSSNGIYNLVRALTKPYVGAHFIYKRREYKVWKAKEIFDNAYGNIEPGKVIEVMSDTHFVVKTYDNLIEILECDMIDIQVGEYL